MSRRIDLVNVGDFRTLFLEELLWDRPDQKPIAVEVEGLHYTLEQVAGFAGLRVWLCAVVPDRRTQRLIDKEVRKVSTERLLIFADRDVQEWRWLQSPDTQGAGQPRLVTHRHRVGSQNQALDQRLEMIAVSFSDDVNLIGMLRRMRRAFDAEQVTRRFYTEFIAKQRALSDAIEGIEEQSDRDWYAALTMNRLMFIYFLQRKGFMDRDPNYLRSRLERLQVLSEEGGSFYNFYRDFLVPLFHQGLGEKEPTFSDDFTKELVGDVRYINGGIFSHHELEVAYDIAIEDPVFESIFNLFDGYQWHLDDREGGNPNEINPDVLGYIFEQFINQKQMGAYYTKEDVTHFMTSSTLLPVVLSRLEMLGLDVWSFVQSDPDRYVWDGLSYGNDLPFPEEISAERGSHVRPSWLDAPPDVLGLPGESWWDVDFRRTEYRRLVDALSAGAITTVDEAVTANLDLETLTVDVIDSIRDPNTVFAAWRALTELRIVDPTCGSGAFLFAALKVLLPLYSAVLDAANAVAGEHEGVTSLLHEVARHPNVDYFLLKHASLANLYGVDIMKEAVEVARLRLFLKLVSTIETKSKLEPLPDLDFNIKAGNILVGALEAGQIEQASDDLFSGLTAGKVAESARRISVAFREFRTAQEQNDDARSRALRADLLELLDDVRDEVNHQYYAADKRSLSFGDWVDSHHPFHWFIEFPEVFDRGGFDVVIGNPPYIAKSKVKDYSYKGFETDMLPDIYAPCTERASQITNDDGRLSLIVPISATFGDDYTELRNVMKRRFTTLWVSNFSRNPAALFSAGLGVRSTILVASATGHEKRVHVTKTHRWYDAYRPALFETLRYFLLPTSIEARHGWVRLPSTEYGDLLEVVDQHPASLASMDRPRTGAASVGFKQTALYWLAVFLNDPPAYERDGRVAAQTKIGRITLENAEAALLVLAVLASKFAFVWWYCTGDDFDVTSGGLKSTPVDPSKFGETGRAKLIASARAILKDFDNHVLFTPYAGKYMGTYIFSEMRDLTDVIDEVIANELGFAEMLPALEHAYACVYKPTGDRPGTLRRDPFADESQEVG
jgi:hypothetical protein